MGIFWPVEFLMGIDGGTTVFDGLTESLMTSLLKFPRNSFLLLIFQKNKKWVNFHTINKNMRIYA